MADRERNILNLLAGEYVLGTLDGRARRRFERYRDGDAAICAEVEGWERRLSGLVDTLQPVEPPAHLLEAIVQKIAAPSRSEAESGGFWRGFGLAAAVAATLACFYVGWFSAIPPAAPALMVAVLSDNSSTPAMVIRRAGDRPVLLIEAARVIPPPAGRALELWLIPAGAPAPVSLGLLPASGPAEIALDPARAAELGPGAVLAISEEPTGGSPTGLPTGPVLYQGQVLSRT